MIAAPLILAPLILAVAAVALLAVSVFLTREGASRLAIVQTKVYGGICLALACFILYATYPR